MFPIDRDLALAYTLMAGESSEVPLSSYQPVPHIYGITRTSDLSDIVIGVFQPWFDDANPEVRASCQNHLDYLVSKGAKVCLNRRVLS